MLVFAPDKSNPNSLLQQASTGDDKLPESKRLQVRAARVAGMLQEASFDQTRSVEKEKRILRLSQAITAAVHNAIHAPLRDAYTANHHFSLPDLCGPDGKIAYLLRRAKALTISSTVAMVPAAVAAEPAAAAAAGVQAAAAVVAPVAAAQASVDCSCVREVIAPNFGLTSAICWKGVLHECQIQQCEALDSCIDTTCRKCTVYAEAIALIVEEVGPDFVAALEHRFGDLRDDVKWLPAAVLRQHMHIYTNSEGRQRYVTIPADSAVSAARSLLQRWDNLSQEERKKIFPQDFAEVLLPRRDARTLTAGELRRGSQQCFHGTIGASKGVSNHSEQAGRAIRCILQHVGPGGKRFQSNKRG